MIRNTRIQEYLESQQPVNNSPTAAKLGMNDQKGLRPTICPTCGGDWQFQVICKQYSGSAYSSAPGGDLQELSMTEYPIRICPCGTIIRPNLSGGRAGYTAQAIQNSFIETLDKADQAKAVRPADLEPFMELHKAMQEGQFVPMSEFLALKEQFNNLLEILGERKAEAKADPEPAPEVTPAAQPAAEPVQETKQQPVQPPVRGRRS